MRRQELHPHTAVINRTQKSQSKKTRQEALLWLATMFPKAFDNTLKIQPLKIGIMDDILNYCEEAAKHGISKSKLREAVVLFTRRIDYLICLKAREMRIDLEGNPVAPVTEEEAEKAANKIKKRIEKSLRNARKPSSFSTAYPKQSSGGLSSTASAYSQVREPMNPHQIERKPLYSMPNAAPLVKQPAPAVLVKHKTSRPFDPDAVARLKERLGLSKSKQEENQTNSK